MESIMECLRRRLREVGAREWEALARDANVGRHLPRKVVNRERNNVGAELVQRLHDAMDRRAQARTGTRRNTRAGA